MEQHDEKMAEFVDKLFANPNLGKASIIQKENNILAFIKENQQQLQTIFAQPAFFPDLSWEEAVRRLLTVLTDRVLGFFQSRVSAVVDSVIHPDIFAYFRSEGNSHIDKAQFKEFILNAMRTKVVRDQYAAVFDAVQAKFGTTPDHVCDVLAIMGDASDNIPGVKGIGEKGAIKLNGE